MKTKLLLPLLALLSVALVACSQDKDDDVGANGPNDGSLPDRVNVGDSSGLPPQRLPDGINPDTDVNYQTLAEDTVYFSFDSSTIPASERGKLEAVHQWMVANPGHSLFLAGNADKRGTPEYNRALGERRALAVREYLAALGIPPASLYTNSYGSDRPAVEGDTEEAYAKNRRVEVGVVQRP